MRTRIVAILIGKLLGVYTLCLTVPLIYALVYGEAVYIDFLLTALVTGALAGLLARGANGDGHIGIREGYLVVSGAWLITSLLGALPFWLSGCVPSFLDALFESVSGLTATGASVITDLDVIPESILLWRSLTNWLGGMGIIILFLVFLSSLGADGVNLFRAELPGPTVNRVMPRIRQLASTIWLFYLTFTIIQGIFLYLAGMTPFDAINHTFATMATGGFSTRNDSIQHYDSLVIELIIVFFMFVAGGNFALYYIAWRKGIGSLIRNSEFKVYLGLVVGSTLTIALFCWLNSGAPLVGSLRDSLFIVVSLMTTTGFATTDYGQWPPFVKVILVVIMLIGGCAGSTAGGIKVIRLLILLKDAAGTLLRSFHPRLVRAVKVDDSAVRFDVLHTVLRFFFLYILTFCLSALLVGATGLDLFDSLGAVAATLGNIGHPFGANDTATTFGVYQPLAKIVLTLDMLLGRLELFTLLVLLHPEFWQPYLTRSSWQDLSERLLVNRIQREQV